MKEIIIDVIIIMFPIFIYFIYSVNEQCLEKKENDLFFEFCIISSIYLLLDLNDLKELNDLLLNSFLLICYYKKRDTCCIVISIILIGLYSYNSIYLLPLLIIIYGLYYLLYKKNNKYLFIILTIINSLLFLILNGNIGYIALFIILNYILIRLIKKLDEIFNLYKSLDNMHNDEKLITSLFKITHEIKNPLSVCKGYLDMYDYNNINHSKEYIPIVKEEIERTLLILNDFSCISKVNINPDIIDINLLLEQLINNLNLLFKQNNININTNIIDEEVYINGDYNRLMQVFVNILKNSVEAIESNGLIELNDYIEDNNIVILFKDNGIGIKDIEKIKEPFFTTKTNGTGLGVPLSIEIIKKHNGSIDYISNNKGTLVTIKLPIINFNN